MPYRITLSALISTNRGKLEIQLMKPHSQYKERFVQNLARDQGC